MTTKKQKRPTIKVYDPTRFFTPRSILERVEKLGPIGLDPCGDYESNVSARHTVLSWTRGFEFIARHFSPLPEVWDAEGEREREILHTLARAGIEIADGLAVSWEDRLFPGEAAFVNPPYNHEANKRWGERCAGFGFELRDRHLVALVPVATGARWWRNYWRANAVCFLESRVRFTVAAEAAEAHNFGGSFDSAIAYWGSDVAGFVKAFEGVGQVVSPRYLTTKYL